MNVVMVVINSLPIWIFDRKEEWKRKRLKMEMKSENSNHGDGGNGGTLKIGLGGATNSGAVKKLPCAGWCNWFGRRDSTNPGAVVKFIWSRFEMIRFFSFGASRKIRFGLLSSWSYISSYERQRSLDCASSFFISFQVSENSAFSLCFYQAQLMWPTPGDIATWAVRVSDVRQRRICNGSTIRPRRSWCRSADISGEPDVSPKKAVTFLQFERGNLIDLTDFW